MNTSHIAWVLVALTTFTQSGCSEANQPPSSGERELRASAEQFALELAGENFAGAVKRFDPAMNRAMPESKLREAWRSLLEQAGSFTQILGTRTMPQAGFEIVFVTCEFQRAILDLKVVFDRAGQISGLWFLPGQRPAAGFAASGIAPSTVRENEIKVGDGETALPGTLSFPAQETGLRPAVVLVHGSGPNDRDETVGANKPFRDLAWGLAEKGIAVLRYDKGTKVHPERFSAMRGLTVQEEIVDDALNAVARLRATEGIATNRIFVLGHSLGGTIAPRIAQADPQIAGLIILAGSTRPLEELIVEQTHYILSLDGEFSSDDKARLAKVRAEADKVKRVAPADSTSTTLLFGAPPSYWLDLRRYDAPATARELKQPLLLLQGGRDYQVTAEDFEGWKKALSSRPNATFKFYPELNHLFLSGEGKSGPAEYERPGHLAEEVIRDIAEWISE